MLAKLLNETKYFLAKIHVLHSPVLQNVSTILIFFLYWYRLRGGGGNSMIAWKNFLSNDYQIYCYMVTMTPMTIMTGILYWCTALSKYCVLYL